MPVITKISKQVKNDERYNIFLDEKYAFSVDEEVLARLQLQKGKELEDEDLAEIQFQDDIRKGFNLALHYLSHRMRSEKEIETFLKGKEIEETIIPEILFKLKEYKYINDLEFAIAYVRTQMATTKKGPVIIRKELHEKGIQDHFIEESLKEFLFDHQLENGVALGEKVARQNKKLSEVQVKQKIEQTLIRKGFGWDIIQEVLDAVSYEKEEDEEWDAVVHQGEKAHRKYAKFDDFEYRQKMKQALYRKGFSMDLIERFIDYINEEESE
ncbi:recombination regulator RecX [Falsibacillus albus]|uniref:Regulatory protein RecX n=1 Tax=Falsibacillus albus TaxID=2478915 RepID=A0A3L7JVB8_9BACI|nr:recombination regulator RecX [Falsibacillus albus]RLQ92382.1 recombination regulator RecX [Falsibacillus albus]